MHGRHHETIETKTLAFNEGRQGRQTDNRKEVLEDFPRDPVVKNPLSNVVGMGLIPGWGTKIPHAVRQLSPQAATKDLT